MSICKVHRHINFTAQKRQNMPLQSSKSCYKSISYNHYSSTLIKGIISLFAFGRSFNLEQMRKPCNHMDPASWNTCFGQSSSVFVQQNKARDIVDVIMDELQNINTAIRHYTFQNLQQTSCFINHKNVVRKIM